MIAVFVYDGSLRNYPVITHLCGVFPDVAAAKEWIKENKRSGDKYYLSAVDEV